MKWDPVQLYEQPPVGARQADIDRAIIEMERNGFLLDSAYCSTQEAAARADEDRQLEVLRQWAWNATGQSKFAARETSDPTWSSGPQLKELLHGVMRLERSPVWKKGRVKLRRGETKLDEVALDWIARRYPRLGDGIRGIINLRRIRGSIKYLSKLPNYVAPDGRIHPVFGPAGDGDDRVGAVTGRQAVKNPEGQQLPRNKKKDRYRVRRAIVAAPGNALVVADYSALEVVILAHICYVLFGDTQLMEMTRPGAPDIHSTNARRIFGELLGWTVPDEYPGAGGRVADLPLEAFKSDEHPELEHPYGKLLRDMVKAVWYGLQYGKGAYGFGASLLDATGNPIGEELAGTIVEGLLTAVPALRLYQNWVREFIGVHHGICSLAGRWCDLSQLLQENAEEWERNRAWRRALNYPMQGGGADIIGAAMVAVVDDPVLRALGYRLILQVHDELILEGPAENAASAKERVVHLMVNCFPLTLALQVSAHSGANWEEAK